MISNDRRFNRKGQKMNYFEIERSPSRFKPRELNHYETAIEASWPGDKSCLRDSIHGWVHIVASVSTLKPSQIDKIVDDICTDMFGLLEAEWSPFAAVDHIRNEMIGKFAALGFDPDM